MIRYANSKAHGGDMVFRGQNPPAGAIVDYYLKAAQMKLTLTVHDAAGRQVSAIAPSARKGLNRVVWNLRYPPLGKPAGGGSDDDEGGGSGQIDGPFVLPGTYTVG